MFSPLPIAALISRRGLRPVAALSSGSARTSPPALRGRRVLAFKDRLPAMTTRKSAEKPGQRVIDATDDLSGLVSRGVPASWCFARFHGLHSLRDASLILQPARSSANCLLTSVYYAVYNT